jgi:predicted nucleic acid-binding protein
MKAIFGDTYYFLAVGNERDEGHQRAVQYAASYKGPIITTEWVLTEVADALASPAQREQFLNLLELIYDDSNWKVVAASHELFDRGISLFSQRPDKEWSLTDCISFVVMKEHGLTETLTADHHFEQAGFVRLLK